MSKPGISIVITGAGVEYTFPVKIIEDLVSQASSSYPGVDIGSIPIKGLDSEAIEYAIMEGHNIEDSFYILKEEFLEEDEERFSWGNDKEGYIAYQYQLVQSGAPLSDLEEFAVDFYNIPKSSLTPNASISNGVYR